MSLSVNRRASGSYKFINDALKGRFYPISYTAEALPDGSTYPVYTETQRNYPSVDWLVSHHLSVYNGGGFNSMGNF